MLALETLHAGYGTGTVLEAITLHIEPATVHAVVGHNGAGKTTLIHTIAGIIRPTRGNIRLHGQDITTWSAHRRARAGIALVPQGRRVWPSLTVAEHLTIATGKPRRGGQGWDRARVLDLLPQLAARLRHRGGQLSGGEQQMLAIARALLTQPRLLLLDEPTEGLAPGLVAQIHDLITRLSTGGLTILLTSPQPHLVVLADQVTLLTTGHATPLGAGQPEPAVLQAALAPTATHRHEVNNQPPTGRPSWADLTAPAHTRHKPTDTDPSRNPTDTSQHHVRQPTIGGTQ